MTDAKLEFEIGMSFFSNSKLADLVDSNPNLLSTLIRLEIHGSYGEKTLNEVCTAAGLDSYTVLTLFKVYTISDYKPSHNELKNCKIEDIILYLKNSHSFYTTKALKHIEQSIDELLSPCGYAQKSIINRFYSEYKSELENHFVFIEEKMIPYINELLMGRSISNLMIDDFDEDHDNVDAKLSDLKRLIIKSLPQECDDSQRASLLRYLFWLQNDLRIHSIIEDSMLVPMARLLENPRLYGNNSKKESIVDEDQLESLSEREKEILISVAKGLINKEIADKHNISINTVITHRRNITRKTGIKTVSGLTVYAILNNLVDITDI